MYIRNRRIFQCHRCSAHEPPLSADRAFVLAINYLSSLSDEFDDATRDEVYAQLAQKRKPQSSQSTPNRRAAYLHRARTRRLGNMRRRAIVNFIAENALKYEMSLDYLTEHFALCGKTIGAAIKRVTG